MTWTRRSPNPVARKRVRPGSPVAVETDSNLAIAERQKVLAPRLAGVLRGDDRPKDGREWLDFAVLCYDRNLHASATRLYASAFEADPKWPTPGLATPLRRGLQPALAASGTRPGRPAPRPGYSRSLMQAGLELAQGRPRPCSHASRSQDAEGPSRCQGAALRLEFGKFVPDLAGVRDPGCPSPRLPEEERKGWHMLWIEVETLLKKTQSR